MNTQYLKCANGSVAHQKIHTVVISTQPADPLKATRSKEVAGYIGPDATTVALHTTHTSSQLLFVRHV